MRIILLLVLLVPAVIAGCVLHINNVCGQEPNRPPEAERTFLVCESGSVTPHPKNIPVYDIPLSAELQEYTYEKCLEYGVDHLMILAIMEVESGYRAGLISDTDDYGLMQVNGGNLGYLEAALGEIDLLDPKHNIEAGVFWLSGICKNYSDPHRILTVYHTGGRIAEQMWDKGIRSTVYSRNVVKTMEKIKEREALK